MGVDRDCVSHYVVFGMSRRPDNRILVCPRTRYISSTMSLFHSELRFVTLWSKPREQASKLLHLAEILVCIVDLG